MIVGKLLTLLQDEAGVTAIEYGIIASLISVTLVVGYEAVGSLLHDIFIDVGDILERANELRENN